VNTKLNIKEHCLSKEKLLLGSYDYRNKYLQKMEDGKHDQCIAARKLKKATSLLEESRVEDHSFSRGGG
jgi:hypothetical protein